MKERFLDQVIRHIKIGSIYGLTEEDVENMRARIREWETTAKKEANGPLTKKRE